MPHHEPHKSHRIGWLRAAVLGANDGIVSTASMIIGFVAAGATQTNVLLAGVAGLVAGSMSMAAGEYVSVSSQLDTEKADLELEKKSLENDFEFELIELALIYEKRGLDQNLARQVAEQLMYHDALGAHARDDIGISDTHGAKPIQAAVYSAISFTAGAALPLMVVWFTPTEMLITVVSLASIFFLGFLGALAAYSGGASIILGISRVILWGSVAMGVTAAVGHPFGVTT